MVKCVPQKTPWRLICLVIIEQIRGINFLIEIYDLYDITLIVHDYLDQDEAIKSRMMKLSDGSWTCTVCGYISNYQTTMWKHVEAKHVALPVMCKFCEKLCPSKNALASHVSRNHRASKQYKA